MKSEEKVRRRLARARRHHAQTRGNGKPRLIVFRSSKAIYAQIIDEDQNVICGTSNLKGSTGVAGATEVGKSIADLAKKKKIEAVVFDRNGFKYHGRVKALAEAAREGGLKF